MLSDLKHPTDDKIQGNIDALKKESVRSASAMGVKETAKSLWNNQFVWTLGKSWGVFLVAIFIARQMADAEAEQALELAAQKAVPSL